MEFPKLDLVLSEDTWNTNIISAFERGDFSPFLKLALYKCNIIIIIIRFPVMSLQPDSCHNTDDAINGGSGDCHNDKFDVTIDVKVGIMTIFVIIGIYVSEFCRTFIQYSKKVLQTSDWDAGQLLVLSLISPETKIIIDDNCKDIFWMESSEFIWNYHSIFFYWSHSR